MGKRKERRLAAMGATGRRVKLDLFAEPSGDLGGSSIPDDVGGEDDLKNRAGLPSSPSSSGQQPQNPLLLLGQYSDDELDEGSKEGGNTDDAESPVGDTEEQAKVDAGKEDESVGVNEENDSVMQKVEQFILEMDSDLPDPLEKPVEDGNIEKKAIEHGHPDLTEQIAPATSDKQAIADVTSGWKMVLHEESNQYYYWNVVTGETSWEVPDVLAQASDSVFIDKAGADSVEQNDTVGCTRRDSLTVGVKVDDSTSIRPSDVYNISTQNSLATDSYGHGQELDALKEGCSNGALDEKKECHDSDQGKLQDSSGSIDTQRHETPLPRDDVSFRPSTDALVGIRSASIYDSVTCTVDMRQEGEYETGAEFSSRLTEHCEYLLKLLKSINRAKDDLILKCITEIEIRMNDIMSLASNGSSMLPFWDYSEKKLKQLEETINNVVYQHHKDVPLSEIEDDYEPGEIIGDDIKAGLGEEASGCPPNGDSHAPMLAGKEVGNDSYAKAYDDGAMAAEHVSTIGIHTAYSASGAGGTVEVDGLASQSDITPQTVLHSGEGTDMDVDMEVEDAVPPDASYSQFYLAAEQLNLQNPPPPDDDWIPPPPPDNEPYPPPPPEEPPEAPHPPPTTSESVQTFSYTDQYNQSYPGSTYEYYGQTNMEVPGTSFYAYSEGCQVAVSNPSVYYETAPTMYSAAPVMVNPSDPVAYYALQDGLVPPTSVGGGIESSSIGSVSGYKSFNSDTLRSLSAHSKADSIVLPKTKDYVPEVGGDMEKASLKLPSSQAPTAISVPDSVSVPSTSAVTTSIADTATTIKGQSKVSRTKKRTVAVASTLRSNKKVSSLVDKWKAAKEEMHEDEEEEPVTYLEKLEKKRQREIEQWRAQQIASGEAKENANFQPLGGDWRERVKRKRAQLMKEREQSPANGVAEGTQQPDLNELSKGLTSGWQAYWDDSSKQVYYGNAATSETAWIRPTT